MPKNCSVGDKLLSLCIPDTQASYPTLINTNIQSHSKSWAELTKRKCSKFERCCVSHTKQLVFSYSCDLCIKSYCVPLYQMQKVLKQPSSDTHRTWILSAQGPSLSGWLGTVVSICWSWEPSKRESCPSSPGNSPYLYLTGDRTIVYATVFGNGNKIGILRVVKPNFQILPPMNSLQL